MTNPNEPPYITAGSKNYPVYDRRGRRLKLGDRVQGVVRHEGQLYDFKGTITQQFFNSATLHISNVQVPLIFDTARNCLVAGRYSDEVYAELCL